MSGKVYHVFYKSKDGDEIMRFHAIEGAVNHFQSKMGIINLGLVTRAFAENNGLVVLGYSYLQGYKVSALNGEVVGHIIASERLTV